MNEPASTGVKVVAPVKVSVLIEGAVLAGVVLGRTSCVPDATGTVMPFVAVGEAFTHWSVPSFVSVMVPPAVLSATVLLVGKLTVAPALKLTGVDDDGVV